MNQRSKRKFGGWLAFAMNASIALSLIPAARAQVTAPTTDPTSAPPAAPDNAPVQKLGAITVTGSNIPNAGEALAVPVAIVTPEQIQNSGVDTNVLDILRKISPAISGIGGENATLSTSDNFGGSAISIHNLPTLVLINGRRMSYAPSDAVGGLEFVDLNMIPVAAVARIEVLSDGSSAIYGSDAVGGVVNIILKQDYNGWDLRSHFGVSDNTGHYTERSDSLVGGVSDGKTSITISAEYTENPQIYESQRPYTNPYYATTYIPGIVEIGGLTSSYDEAFQLTPGRNAPPGGGNYTMAQLVAMGVYTDLGSFNSPGVLAKVQQQLNLADLQTLAQSFKRESATIDLEHKIFDDKLVLFGDVLYSHTNTETGLNAQPLFPYLSDPNSDLGVYGVTPPASGTEYVPFSAPTNPISQASIDQGFTNGSGGEYVLVHDRFIQYPRLFQDDSTATRIVAGLKGQINEDWSWEVGSDFARYQLSYTNANLLDTNNLIAGFSDGSINPFAITQAPGALDGVLGSAFVNGLSTLNEVDAVIRGAIFDLPAGKVNIAVGGEMNRQNLSATPDNNTANNLWIDSPTILPFNQNRTVNSVYGEIEVPIVSKAQAVPGIYSLVADVADRYDHYSVVGNSTVPKVDLKYSPFDDQLTLRASAGKSFIAPSLYDLYGPTTQGSSQQISYTGANGTPYEDVQFQAAGGSNPLLKPSKANSWTAGLVYSPKAVSELTFTFDYFSVVEHGTVGSVDQTTVIQSVEDFGASSLYAQNIHFGSVTGPGPTGSTPGQISSRPLSTVYIVTPLTNLGADAEKGFDAAIDYSLHTTNLGTFEFNSTATVYNSYMIQILPSENYYQYAGHVSTNAASIIGVGGTVPRWRTYTTVEWKGGGWDALVGQSFVPSVTDIGTGGVDESPGEHVASYDQYDFALTYHFGHLHWGKALDGLTATVGVNNAFNYMPPVAPYDLQQTYADIGTYNGPVGRLWFTDIEYKF